jgi:hypothetical protein
MKRTSLESFVKDPDQEAPPVAPAAAPPPSNRREKVKGTHQLSVYAPLAGYEQLRQLAHDERKKMHDYLLLGLDLVFRQKGLPSMAELKARDGDA